MHGAKYRDAGVYSPAFFFLITFSLTYLSSHNECINENEINKHLGVVMKKATLCLLTLITFLLTGCFSNQQLDKSAQMVGGWKLKGGLEIPGITKRRPSLNIEHDMEVTGFTGCNLFKGKVQSDGAFSLPAVTQKMCLPELVKQENEMLNVLRSATSIEVINSSLIVDAGDKFLVFEKTNAS